jgi:hypothetical protein
MGGETPAGVSWAINNNNNNNNRKLSVREAMTKNLRASSLSVAA